MKILDDYDEVTRVFNLTNDPVESLDLSLEYPELTEDLKRKRDRAQIGASTFPLALRDYFHTNVENWKARQSFVLSRGRKIMTTAKNWCQAL